MSTSLITLVHNENLDGLRAAIDDGADVNEVSHGTNALLYAAERGFAEGITLLIEKGADPSQTNEREDTPLIVAVVHKQPGAAKALIAGGANLETPNKIGSTPLNYVVRMNAGGGVTMTQTITVDGVTKEVPVDMSPMEQRAMEVGRILLEAGANADSEDGNGMTALHHAAGANALDWAKLLLDGGANPVHANGRGYQAIHSACGKGHIDMATLLLERGADASAADTSGFTPLHDAAAAGNQPLVDLLLAKGADKQAKVIEGWKEITEGMTPHDVAAVKGHEALAEILK